MAIVIFFQRNGAAYQGLWKENGKIIGFDPQGRQAFNAGVNVKDGRTGGVRNQMVNSIINRMGY